MSTADELRKSASMFVSMTTKSLLRKAADELEALTLELSKWRLETSVAADLPHLAKDRGEILDTIYSLTARPSYDEIAAVLDDSVASGLRAQVKTRRAADAHKAKAK